MEDFREYMRLKNEKLHEQFLEQQKAAQGDRGGIFSGVCIFVNGFTKPSHLVRPCSLFASGALLMAWATAISLTDYAHAAGAQADHG